MSNDDECALLWIGKTNTKLFNTLCIWYSLFTNIYHLKKVQTFAQTSRKALRNIKQKNNMLMYLCVYKNAQSSKTI